MELVIRENQMQEVAGVTAEYPYVLNRANSSRMRVPWHWHEEVEFTLVRQGRLRVTISGKRFEFGEGEGFFLNTNILHTMESSDAAQPVCWDSHMLHPMLLGGHYKSVFDWKYMAPILKNRKIELTEFRPGSVRQEKILALLDNVSEVQGQPYAEFRVRNLFSEIWVLLLQETKDLEQRAMLTKPVSQERIQLMLEFIHQHYAQKLTLDQIAAAALIGKRECLRCFQSCIGKAPFAYLLDYRVQMAEKLLRTTERSITEIALDTGFSGSAYFAKTFRELRGISPSQYRKTVK